MVAYDDVWPKAQCPQVRANLEDRIGTPDAAVEFPSCIMHIR
jgi:hypothetical protein